MAWRVMAATAMDQPRLKAQAGVKNTGRKSDRHLLHFTLSWHPEEASTLDRREMMRAVTTMLHVMGAQDHQCLVVAHNDQPQPHVHVLVNRVHPRDGRMLSSSFEKLKASRWAEEYERKRGKIYCEERVLNNQARDRGEFTRGEKDEPRHVYDALAAANDNDARQRLLDEHRRRAALVKEQERQQAERHRAAWRLFEQTQRRERLRLAQAAKTVLAKSLQGVRQEYRPRWAQQHHEFQAQQRQFELREAKLLGRVQNALRGIDLAALVGRGKPADDGRVRTIGAAFGVLANAGTRRQVLEERQAAAKRLLQTEQRGAEARLRQEVRAAKETALAEKRKRLELARGDLVFVQGLEQAKIRAQWRENRRQLREAVQELRRPTPQPIQQPKRPQPTPDFNEAVRPGANENRKPSTAAPKETPAKSPAGPIKPVEPTRASELLPRRDAQQAAKQIDEWKEMRAAWLERDAGPERQDEIDR
jgi:hypothetical protein